MSNDIITDMTYIKIHDKHYPVRCSFCVHFRIGESDKKTEFGGIIHDPDKSSCCMRAMHVTPWAHKEHGVNPFVEIPKDCELFSLPEYYFLDWKGQRSPGELVEI